MNEDGEGVFSGERFIGLLPNGSIRMRGLIVTPEYRIEPIIEQCPRKELFGLPWEEVIQYFLVKVDEDGKFISGEKRLPDKPWGPDNPSPPFLKKHPASD
jgi:hypothetical protein